MLDTQCLDCQDRDACRSGDENCARRPSNDDSGLVLRLRMNTAHWRSIELAVPGSGPLSIFCQVGLASEDDDTPAFLIIDDLVLERVKHQWHTRALPVGWTVPLRPWQ